MNDAATPIDEPTSGARTDPTPAPRTDPIQSPVGAGWRAGAPSAQPSGPPRQSSLPTGKGQVEGDVHGFTERTEIGTGRQLVNLWSFRVERFDEDGNQLESVPVMMKGRRFTGFVSDGNRVTVFGKRKQGRVLLSKKLYNQTTESFVVAKGYGLNSRYVVPAVALLVVLLVGGGAFALFRSKAEDAAIALKNVPSLGGQLRGGGGGAIGGSGGNAGAGSGTAAGAGTGTAGSGTGTGTGSGADTGTGGEPGTGTGTAPGLVSVGPGGCSPTAVTIQTGSKVTWSNDTGGTPIQLTIADKPAGVAPQSFDIGPGETWDVTLSTAGTWSYWVTVPASATGATEVVVCPEGSADTITVSDAA